ncbi:E3 ubiquitin-protein ligase TRIM35-like [Chaetodon auriga]|uniref:E3 ubiquitin-protein ligase TRIM35-like n=1 Tax=Chaetodon auriga TaxID=39042 RepID=UPI0040329396
MAFRWSAASGELSCPVCQDTFKDPVLLNCSHSFCQACVRKWWRTKRTRECPVCKTVSSTKSPPRNLVLKNLCEAFLLEVESGVVCPLHTEKLKLYCEDHRTPVCVVCRDSTSHRNHTFTPVNEAAEFHRNGLQEHLTPLRAKVKLFREVKATWEKTEGEIKNQSQRTEETIREEFDVLRRFLLQEETARIAALKEEEELKTQMMRNKIAVVSEQINFMESTIKSIEGGLNDEDTSFLLKVDAITKEVQRPLPDDPEQVTGALIDVGKHLGNMSFDVWIKMKDIVSYTPVIMNSNTANEDLHFFFQAMEENKIIEDKIRDKRGLYGSHTGEI